MLAETYYMDFEDPQRASDEYEKVYTLYPKSSWAPKALYARFWINYTIIKNDSIARQCAAILYQTYPGSEYSISAQNAMGLDSPEEEKTETLTPSEKDYEPDTP